MAIRAESKLDLEEGIAPGGNVALGAGNRSVLAGQRISGRQVVFHGESGRTPALDTMAGFALAAVRASGELAIMGIGLVAIRAELVRNGTLEVGAGMAAFAGHLQMLAKERKPGSGVVESRRECALLPGTGIVARFATLLERAVMRVPVAVGAIVELQAEIARRAVGAGCVAFLAGYLGVRPGEREAGLGVVNLLSSLPVGGVVALQAVRAQRTLMLVLMAVDAGASKSQVGVVEVFGGEHRSFRRTDPLRSVAASASHAGVLAIERKACLRMIKRSGRGVPLYQLEVLAVVV